MTEDSPHALEGVCCIELNFLASAFMNLFHARQRVGCGTGMNITEDSESATEQGERSCHVQTSEIRIELQ